MQRSFDEFKADIQDFHNMKNKILMESPSEIVLFINIDCQPITTSKASQAHHIDFKDLALITILHASVM